MKNIYNINYLELMGLLLGIISGCVYYFPASWVSSYIYLNSDNYILLQNPEGTIWEGSAVLTIVYGNNKNENTSLPSRVSWKIVPKLKGVDISLKSDCCLSKGVNARLSFKRLLIKSGTASLPIEIFNIFGGAWNALSLGGSLEVNWNNIDFSWKEKSYIFQGNVNLIASEVSTSLAKVSTIGSYIIDLNFAREIVNFKLKTIDGPFSIAGVGSLQRGKLSFNGVAETEEKKMPDVENLHLLLGKRDGNKTIIEFGKI